MKLLNKGLLGLMGGLALALSSPVHALGSSTYTYLRCFYKVTDTPRTPATTYVWGLDPATGGYYKVRGNWWADGLLNWKNMFYTTTSQAALQSACEWTLAKKGIARPVAMFAGADTSLSLNYTIWTQDVASTSTKINKIVTFGDSLSDNQNLYNATQWQVPNKNSWFVGHFSNGKVWEEYVGGALGLPVYNWAVAGAAADTYYVIPGVSDQVDSYLIYMRDAANYKPANTLFTMLVGGNDLVNYNRTVDSIIAKEQQALEKLIAHGARNILLLNVPDVTRAPVFGMRSDDAAVKANVDALNARLVQMRDALQAKYGAALNLKLFDTYAMFNRVLANPAAYGLNNVSQSCLDINSDSSTNYATQQGLRSNCSDPNTFVFWDTLHPTTKMHSIISSEVSSFVRTNFAALQ